MSAVSLLPALKEKPSEESQQNGPNQSGLDESGGGSGDPAVLAMGPARRPLQYSIEQMKRLRDSPLVKCGLDAAFAGCEALALVLKKRSESPNEDDRGARGDAPNENHNKGVYGRERRSADPRERVRKESEPSGGGIVLSPQRRSFTSGCGAPAAASAAPPPHLARTRPESPLSQPHPPKTAEQAGRRIGSGRIMVRDEGAGRGREEGEYRSTAEPYRPPPTRGEHARSNADRGREEGEHRSTAEPYRPPPTRGEHARSNADRFDRRSFGRDSFSSDIKRERDDRFNNEKNHRDDNRRSGGRFSQRRFEKEDEPEWFSGGPTSQLETIELRGFDEPVKNDSSNSSNSKGNDKWNSSGGGRSPTERWRAEPEPQPPPQAHEDTLDTTNGKDSGVETKSEEPTPRPADHPDFNLDDFLKFDSIPEVLTNGSSETEGSRFSRWFRRDSPTNDTRHFEQIMNNMVDDLEKPTRIEPPTEPAHVFAPISPVAPVGVGMAGMGVGVGMAGVGVGVGMQAQRQPAPPSLLELLRRANANPHTPDTRPANNYMPEMNSLGTKIHSLEELEARLRPQHSAPHAQPPPESDMSAFKRLMAQVSGGHAITADSRVPQQPLSLIQMLNKSVEAAQKAAAQQPPPQQPHIPQDLVVKLLHVQQQQQQQQQRQQQHAMNEMGITPADRDLLLRPEAQAIIHGLKAGEITVQHLMQQLSNPGLQSRHRDVLLTILRLHQQRQMGGSPLPSGMGVPPHLVVPPTHQPLRISPLPSVPARIPSPRELAAHTQSIMQNALIKKKLEEQRENFRRRHEQPPKHPTPISFTPTSVLRKMTAEKESEAPSPKQQQQWGPHKLPQGRPIVKGNQSGVATYTEYPQNYMAQPPQMSSAGRSFPHPQQRQPVQNNYNNMSNMNNMSSMSNMSNMNTVRGVGGMPAGTTLHQLLVQSHQRNINEMAGNGAGDNQLARWFSPELLARASAGKLPSVHVPNALSLEDLERHHHSPAPPVRN